jgi:hypothetical protein
MERVADALWQVEHSARRQRPGRGGAFLRRRAQAVRHGGSRPLVGTLISLLDAVLECLFTAEWVQTGAIPDGVHVLGADGEPDGAVLTSAARTAWGGAGRNLLPAA